MPIAQEHPQTRLSDEDVGADDRRGSAPPAGAHPPAQQHLAHDAAADQRRLLRRFHYGAQQHGPHTYAGPRRPPPLAIARGSGGVADVVFCQQPIAVGCSWQQVIEQIQIGMFRGFFFRGFVDDFWDFGGFFREYLIYLKDFLGFLNDFWDVERIFEDFFGDF